MLKQLEDKELKELQVIHQVMHQLSLAHRPLAWKSMGLQKKDKKNKVVINTLIYLSLIHSEIENISDVLLDNRMYDVYTYKEQIKEAIIRADNHYNNNDLHPQTMMCIENIRNLLEI